MVKSDPNTYRWNVLSKLSNATTVTIVATVRWSDVISQKCCICMIAKVSRQPTATTVSVSIAIESPAVLRTFFLT